MHVLSSPWQQVSCEHATSCWRPPVVPWAPWTWQTAASRRHAHQNTRNTELTRSRERRTNPEELSFSFQEMHLKVQMHYARINALCAVCLRQTQRSEAFSVRRDETVAELTCCFTLNKRKKLWPDWESCRSNDRSIVCEHHNNTSNHNNSNTPAAPFR